MNHGVIEQVGTPLEVYGEPRTAFVADFIGSMNFLPGQVTAAGAQLGELALACATTGFAPGSAVTVAIRPEDIVVQDVREGDANAFRVEVVWMEFLGSYVRARLKAPAIEAAELAADLSVNAVRRLGIAEGRSLLVRLPAERLRVYPRD
jgi:iron(III) transport system ATP-binding protein